MRQGGQKNTSRTLPLWGVFANVTDRAGSLVCVPVACLFLEESQQPTCPQDMHILRCTYVSPKAMHCAQSYKSGIGLGSCHDRLGGTEHLSRTVLCAHGHVRV